MPHLVFHPHHLHPPLLSHHHPPLLRTQNPTAWIHSARPLGLLSLKPTIGSTIRCMANPRRVTMVAKQIRRELSDMLLTDKVLQYAILPEASLGADKYLSSLTTISDVEVSGDLQVLYAYFHLCFWVFFEFELQAFVGCDKVWILSCMWFLELPSFDFYCYNSVHLWMC